MVKFFRNIIGPTDFTIKPVDLKTAIPLAFCRWHLKRLQILVPLSCCGARKNRRAVRLLDFFDRCHSLASLHRPQGAVGSLPGLEPPVRSTERHKRKEPIPFGMSSFLVPLTGIEPVQYCYRGILSPLRLPVPPQRHKVLIYFTIA